MLNNTIGYMICETAAVEEPKSKIISSSGRRVTAEVLLQDMDIKNRNGRYYSKKWMIPQLTCQRQTELIRTQNMFGEEGHPQAKDLGRQQTVMPGNRCHLITKLWYEGNDILAHVRGANNDIGESFNQDLLDGAKPSFSLRALGTVRNTANGAEVENVTVITWDRVIYPSHMRAYTKNVVEAQHESTILSIEGTPLNENKIYLPDNDKGIITPFNNDSVRNFIKHESANIHLMIESMDMYYDSIILLENKRQVQMTCKDGNVFIISLENHVHNQLMNACSNRY